jgi:hypothetical protein
MCNEIGVICSDFAPPLNLKGEEMEEGLRKKPEGVGMSIK